MPTYDWKCATCEASEEVVCKMSELGDYTPTCSEHGDMVRLITNNQKHTDNTEWRKGHYNSKESSWR